MERSLDRDPAPARTAVSAFASARIIALALAVGVVLLWVVAWMLTEGGARPVGAGEPVLAGPLPLYVWMAIALPGFIGAMVLRGKVVAQAEAARRGGAEAAAGVRGGRVQSELIIAWALLEAAALFAGVMVILNGAGWLLWYAAPLYLLGVLLTFPQPEWFGVDPRRA